MKSRKIFGVSLIVSVLLLGLLLAARSGGPTAEGPARQNALVSSMAPAGAERIENGAGAPMRAVVEPVSSVPVREMPVGEYFPEADQYQRWLDGEIDMEFEGIPPALRPLLIEEAMNLPPATLNPASGVGPVLLDSWQSIDSNECSGGGTVTPPDPEMAAGPNHVIAVVNLALEIYDKSGTSLVGPVTYGTFFAPLGAACSTGGFDPNVLYDESTDRFIIAVDGDGAFYCVAASQTSDPTGAYNLYAFPTNVGGAFFYYPHAGIGRDALYMGANLFGSGQGYVYAMDKAAMYAGNAANIVTEILPGGFHTTPQPMNLHGWLQGTWPMSGPHYIVANSGFSNAEVVNLYSWDDPFGANNLTLETSFNLESIHGVPVSSPINSVQQGGSGITANDPRVLDFEYRNGT